ncbi:CLUMA_CG012573, isoform B [Clunio marinus]|uniref:CLUMA_CG012573, isoform B n=1 Tax=Clunio marinus TaxID=568069 RepID=A0A1J1IGS4_9DIPT|nr:CLUMA_CG012573, isoform B [Clunio marinus]
MSMPQRPRDTQLANIIDKLAEFVARNGPEFEQMTKIKQQNNAKFAFLQNGSEFNAYYQYRVMEERRNLIGTPPNLNTLQQQQQQQLIWSSNGNPPKPQNVINYTAQIESINGQQMKLREQIMQSEKNLTAQHQVLLQQQKGEIEDAIDRAQADKITQCAQENQISINELDDVLQPIIESCTKDSIANGKLWILQQTSNSAKSQIISQYILKKAMSPSAAFTQKLHLIYLINDLLHYCVRKNADDLKNALESVVIPMFCNATISANDDEKDKLDKLLTLWSSKANFFDSCAISKLQSPPSSIQEYQNTLFSQYASVITPLTQATKAKFETYQQQHQAYVKHATNQIKMLETEKQKLEQQNIKQQQPQIIQELAQNSQQMIPSLINSVNMIMNQQQQQQNRTDVSMMQNMLNNQNFQNQHQNFPFQQQITPHQQKIHIHAQQEQFQNFNLPPPSFSIPDLSRPPPGFSSAESSPSQSEQHLIAAIAEEPDPQPYFTLPAGLMVPLIDLEECNYHSLDTEKIKLPPAAAPTDKLLNAVEAFYSAPSHERPRDLEGWEKLGLYEYFKIKNAVRKQKEESIAKGSREKSKSPSPIPASMTKPVRKQKKRIFHSKSPEPRTSRSKSRSVTPETRPTIVATINRNRNKKRSRSPSPQIHLKRNFNRESRIDRRKRSVTPPSFMGAASKTATDFIDEGNKGHQMLKKLGWTSGGLGAVKNQGITEPISGGEIRDRNDLYKGVGMNTNDPYENFRKNRSNNFIVRMKSRSEDKN